VNRQARSTPHLSRGRTALTVATLSLCGTVVALQQTLVVPLLHDLPRLLDTTVDNASWLITATLLSGTVATPVVSRLADMFGKRLMMIVCLAVMTSGSVIGAFSDSLPGAVAARGLQGVGMALVPVGIAIMRDELPREKVPLGVALMSATLAIGAGAGLPLAGVIAEHMDWHAIFWITGGAGVVMLVAIRLIIPESPVRTRGAFDYRGALVLSAGLTAVLLALSKGGLWGWGSVSTIGLAALGLTLLVAWVPLELTVPSPLVDVRTAARPSVLLVNVSSVLVGFAMFANLLVTTLLLQLPESTGFGLGLGMLETGLWMAPSAMVFGVLAPVAAWLTRRFSPQFTLTFGAGAMAVAYVSRVYLSHSLPQIVIGSMLVAVGTSLAYAAMPTLIMRAVPVTETASANGLNTLLRSLGSSTSSATVAAVVSMGAVTTAAGPVPTFGALSLIFWLAATTAAAAVVVALPLFRLTPTQDDELLTSSEGQLMIARGAVLTDTRRPVGGAVVTILGDQGQHVDWNRADASGNFTLAVRGPGRYLLVVAAEGWAPHSCLVHLGAGSTMPPVVLQERLTISGRITDQGSPVQRAGVVLTRRSGEVTSTAASSDDGRFSLPTPPEGRYVLTVVNRTQGTVATHALTLTGDAHVIDVEMSPLPRTPSVNGGGSAAVKLATSRAHSSGAWRTR